MSCLSHYIDKYPFNFFFKKSIKLYHICIFIAVPQSGFIVTHVWEIDMRKNIVFESFHLPRFCIC